MAAGKTGGCEEGGLPRLPPGRHGLSREFVVENQRGRIAAGMIEVVVSGGYMAATVTQVVAAAGVSRRTFYNYYNDKAEAFFDVYGQVTDLLAEAMVDASAAEKGGWAASVKAELGALLDCFAANAGSASRSRHRRPPGERSPPSIEPSSSACSRSSARAGRNGPDAHLQPPSMGRSAASPA